LCFGAGLATGLSHFWAMGCGVLVAGIAALLRERRAVVFIAGAAAGFTIGLIARHGVDRTCAARLPTHAPGHLDGRRRSSRLHLLIAASSL